MERGLGPVENSRPLVGRVIFIPAQLPAHMPVAVNGLLQEKRRAAVFGGGGLTTPTCCLFGLESTRRFGLAPPEGTRASWYSTRSGISPSVSNDEFSAQVATNTSWLETPTRKSSRCSSNNTGTGAITNGEPANNKVIAIWGDSRGKSCPTKCSQPWETRTRKASLTNTRSYVKWVPLGAHADRNTDSPPFCWLCAADGQTVGRSIENRAPITSRLPSAKASNVLGAHTFIISRRTALNKGLGEHGALRDPPADSGLPDPPPRRRGGRRHLNERELRQHTDGHFSSNPFTSAAGCPEVKPRRDQPAIGVGRVFAPTRTRSRTSQKATVNFRRVNQEIDED